MDLQKLSYLASALFLGMILGLIHNAYKNHRNEKSRRNKRPQKDFVSKRYGKPHEKNISEERKQL